MKKICLYDKIYLPREIIDLIADYHDYDKYCKPLHEKKYSDVLQDIRDMANFQSINLMCLSVRIAYECWGPGVKYLYNEGPRYI